VTVQDLAASPPRRYRAILRDGVWVIAGHASTGVFSLLGGRLVTQFVSPEVFGVVSLAQNLLLLMRSLFCSPILTAGLRYYPDAQRGHFVSALYRRLRSSLLKAVIALEVTAVTGGLIWIWRSGVNASVLLILVIFTAADVFRTLETTMFNAARRQRAAALTSAAEAFARPVLIVSGVVILGASVQVVLGATALSIALTLLAIYASTRPRTTVDENAMPPAVWAEMIKYAIPLAPLAVLSWLVSVSDRYIIQWLTHDLFSVGVYAASYGLISQPFLLLQGVAVSRQDNAAAAKTFRVWLALAAGLCILALAGIVLFRTLLVRALLGPKYHDAVVVVPWIALGYLFFVVEQVLEQHLLAHKRTKAVLSAQACGALASICVTVPMVASLGWVGAAYSCPIYFLLQGLVTTALVVRGPIKL
jgi:O-antigen/teichoic acid export membrane protein